MLKKIVILALVAQSIPAQAVNWYKAHPSYWLFQTHPSIVRAPIDPATCVLGLPTTNILKTVEKGGELLSNVTPEKVEAVATAASHGTTHGASYGFWSGQATALKDGVVAHPYATAAVLATGVGIAGYRALRPLTPQEEAEQEKAKTEIRAAQRLKLTDDTDTEYRTCLNKHARCGGTADDKIRRCHSPARRLALLNHARANAITAAFKEYQ